MPKRINIFINLADLFKISERLNKMNNFIKIHKTLLQKIQLITETFI